MIEQAAKDATARVCKGIAAAVRSHGMGSKGEQAAFNAVSSEIQAAINAEREECARVAESQHRDPGTFTRMAIERIAAAIRARGGSEA